MSDSDKKKKVFQLVRGGKANKTVNEEEILNQPVSFSLTPMQVQHAIFFDADSYVVTRASILDENSDYEVILQGELGEDYARVGFEFPEAADKEDEGMPALHFVELKVGNCFMLAYYGDDDSYINMVSEDDRKRAMGAIRRATILLGIRIRDVFAIITHTEEG